MVHRAGRVTASLSKQAFNVSKLQDGNFPSSFINNIMQYKKEVDVPATRYGKSMELTARKAYIESVKSDHGDFSCVTTGLHVMKEKPFLGASPDGLISCKCHGEGVLEIKCPFKYKEGLDGRMHDRNFPISPDSQMVKGHAYYFQVQHQMMVTGRSYCHLFIWTNGKNPADTILLNIEKDELFIEQLKSRISDVFFEIVLPEVLTRKNDPKNEQTEKKYCFCSRPTFTPMIACDSSQCEIEWFHYCCVGVVKAPRGAWFCENCKSNNKIK